MDKYFLSVVVPVTREKSVCDLLQSLNIAKKLNFLFEVVLVTSKNFLIKEDDYFFKIKIIKSTEKFSPAKGRNLGVQSAEGEYILFVDDDCIANKDLLVNWYIYINDNNPQIAAGCVLPQDTAFLIQRFCLDKGIVAIASKDVFKGYILGANAVFKKEVFAKLGGFCEKFKVAGGEDVDVSLRAAALGIEVAFASLPLVYHKHSKSIFYWLKKYFNYGKSFKLVLFLNSNNAVLFEGNDYNFFKVFSFLKIPFKIFKNLKKYDKKTQKLRDIFLFPFLSYFFNVVFTLGMFLTKKKEFDE